MSPTSAASGASPLQSGMASPVHLYPSRPHRAARESRRGGDVAGRKSTTLKRRDFMLSRPLLMHQLGDQKGEPGLQQVHGARVVQQSIVQSNHLENRHFKGATLDGLLQRIQSLILGHQPQDACDAADTSESAARSNARLRTD